jgi:hypothetical protein
VPTVGLKMSSLTTSATKSPNKIFIRYLYNLSTIRFNSSWKLCVASYHYRTADVIPLCTKEKPYLISLSVEKFAFSCSFGANCPTNTDTNVSAKTILNVSLYENAIPLPKKKSNDGRAHVYYIMRHILSNLAGSLTCGRHTKEYQLPLERERIHVEPQFH